MTATTTWQDWVGHTTSSDCVLDAAQANRMAATLDREPDITDGDALPPAWHWIYFNEIVPASRLGEEGHPQLGITMPPVPLPRRMWAAGSFEFAGPLIVGARVRRDSTIASITPKDGSTGPLYFVTVEHLFTTDGVTNLREQQTIVYREMSSTATPPTPDPAPVADEFRARWHLDSTALFRYSALTFNGHRIHYDADYARSVEGYPNLVIHGPLLATLLADLAAAHERPLRRFRYRARSPLFVPDPFTVHGSTDGDATRLWAASHQGGLAMTADASG